MEVHDGRYGIDRAPAVANGVVYVASDDRYVYALNASTGALMWKYAASGWIVESRRRWRMAWSTSAPADHNVYALERQHGCAVWKYATGDDVVVFAGGGEWRGLCRLDTDSNVYALNASTGALLWKYTMGIRVTSSPAVVNGMVYVGSDVREPLCLRSAEPANVGEVQPAGASRPGSADAQLVPPAE